MGGISFLAEPVIRLSDGFRVNVRRFASRPGIAARCPIAERGAVGAESRCNSGHGEKVVVAKPVSQSAASVGSRFPAQDFDRSQDEPAGIFWSYQLNPEISSWEQKSSEVF